MGGCRRKGAERVQAEKGRGWSGCNRDQSQEVERRWRIQNDCWRLKSWRQGPGEPGIAQRGRGIKPGLQAVKILLSCEEDTPNARELTFRDPQKDQRQSGQN